VKATLLMEKEELDETLELLVHEEREKEIRIDADLKHRRGIPFMLELCYYNIIIILVLFILYYYLFLFILILLPLFVFLFADW
jgi:hypothetical protein